MDDNLKELLAQKKAQLKVKQQRAEIQQYKDCLTKSIEDFSQKYRYADEAEEVKLGKFISKLGDDIVLAARPDGGTRFQRVQRGDKIGQRCDRFGQPCHVFSHLPGHMPVARAHGLEP